MNDLTHIPQASDASLPSDVVRGWTEWLAGLDTDLHGADDAERVDQLRALEELKAGAAAAQARVTVAFDASQRRQQAVSGISADKQGAGVGAQIALARRDSPARGSRHLGLAKVLVTEMPHTLAALTIGRLSEWRATLLARETACLSAQHRGEVDRRLCTDPRVLDGLGDAGVAAEARKLAYRLDPAAAVRRARRAETDRRVTTRPAPDTMSYVTGLLPVAQGVAVHAALSRHADTLRGQGDPRTRGQIMADAFVQRLTGQVSATATNVEVQLVMSDQTLLGHETTEDPGHLVGYGPIPAGLARGLVRGADQAWVRRLFTRPGTGSLLAMESSRRHFPAGLRRFLVLRDQSCRTPWCDAPIRHADHVHAHRDGGRTAADNGQGLCEACNHAKQALGWACRPSPGPGTHRVHIGTPTGHTYESQAPPLPGASPGSVMERDFELLLAAVS